MPVSYRVDESGLVLSGGSELVTGTELAEYLRTLLADPAVPLPLRDLNDLRAVRRFEVEPAEIRRLVTIAESNLAKLRGARLAVVASADHVYGMSRMLQLLMDVSPSIERLREGGGSEEMRVFRDVEEARDWLAGLNGVSAA